MERYSNLNRAPPVPTRPYRPVYAPSMLATAPSAPMPAGPFGVKYDDSLSLLRINLVVMGIKEKSLTRAANTDVHLKYDDESFSILLEVFKMDKKAKPPKKTILDTRFFEKKKLPGKISKCEFKLKKDQCIVLLHKAVPAVWANALSM